MTTVILDRISKTNRGPIETFQYKMTRPQELSIIQLFDTILPTKYKSNLKMKSAISLAFCLFYVLVRTEGSFIKPNSVPRVGRSNEELSPFDQGSMGYVIKTNKNIPRMGRRNYDSENRYDIPKFYQLPIGNVEEYSDEGQTNREDQIEAYYGTQSANMKR